MTLEKIIKILADFRDFDANTVTRETTFLELGLDSLDVVDLVMKIEEASDTTIPMDGSIKSIGNILDFINKEKA